MGELMFKKGSAEQCAKHCDELAESLEAEVSLLQRAVAVRGFGGFESGASLDNGFSGKVQSAVAALSAHAASARQLAENFRSAEKGFEQQDSSSADSVDQLNAILNGGFQTPAGSPS